MTHIYQDYQEWRALGFGRLHAAWLAVARREREGRAA